MNRNNSLVVALAALLSLVLVSGCSLFQAPVEELDAGSVNDVTITDRNDASTQVDSDPVPLEGLQELGAGDLHIQLTNNTGYELTEIALRPAGGEEWPFDTTFSNVSVAEGEEFILFYPPSSESGIYDLRLTTSDLNVLTFRSTDLASHEDLTLLYTEGVGYTSYVDEATQEEVSNFVEASEAATEASGQEEETYDMQNQRG